MEIKLKKFELALRIKEKGIDTRFRTVIQIEALDRLDAIDKISRLINKPIAPTVEIKEMA
jgi:hypothetical protein